MRQKMTQLVSIVLAVCMLCSMLPISAAAVEPAADAQKTTAESGKTGGIGSTTTPGDGTGGVAVAPTTAPTPVPTTVPRPATLAAVHPVATPNQATNPAITVTTANMFFIGNSYDGRTEILLYVTGLDKNVDWKTPDWSIKKQSDGIHCITKTVNAAEAKEGGYIADIMIANEYGDNPSISYTVHLETHLGADTTPPTVQELNAQPVPVTMKNYSPYMSVYFPKTTTLTDKLSCQLLQGTTVYAEGKGTSRYITRAPDPRYATIFQACEEKLTIGAMCVQQNLYVCNNITEGRYDVSITDEKGPVTTLSGLVQYSADPVIAAIHTYAGNYIGKSEVRVSVSMEGADPGDLQVTLTQDGETLATSSEYRTARAYDVRREALYYLTLPQGTVLNGKSYGVQVSRKDGGTLRGKTTEEMMVYPKSMGLEDTYLVSPFYADVMAWSSAADPSLAYHASIKDGNTVLGEAVAKPVDGVFSFEFKNTSGKIVPLENTKYYSIEVDWYDDYGRVSTATANVDNRWQSPEGGTVLTDYHGWGAFGSNELWANVYVPYSITNPIIPPTAIREKFVLELTRLGGEKIEIPCTGLNQWNRTEDKERQYRPDFLITPEMRLNHGFYKEIALYYDGNPVNCENGDNVLKTGRYLCYDDSPSAGWNICAAGGRNRDYQLRLDYFPTEESRSVEMQLFAAGNETAKPDYTIPLQAAPENPDVYPLTDAALTGVDLGRSYKRVVTVNGKAYEFRDDARLMPASDEGNGPTYAVTVTQPTTGGTLAVDHASAPKWTSVYVTATPDEGMQMKPGSLRLNGKAVGGHSFLLLEDTTITAEFEPMPVITQAVNLNQYTYYGTITTDKPTAAPGEVIKVSAQPDEGYKLVALSYSASWSSTTDGTPIPLDTKAFTMPNYPVWVYAKFAQCQSFTISTAAMEHGAVNIWETLVKENAEVTFKVVPENRYLLDALYYIAKGGTVQVPILEENGYYRFTMPSANITVYATFKEKQSYTITENQPVENGYIGVTSSAFAGEEVSVNFYPNSDYCADEANSGYKVNGEVQLCPLTKRNGMYYFTMPEAPVTVYAAFKPIQRYPLNIATTVTNGTLELNPYSGSYAEGTTITVAVQPSTGYFMEPNSLTYTVAGGTAVPLTAGATAGTYTFTMPAGAVVLNAVFTLVPHYPVNIATTVTNGTLTVMPVAQNGGYTEGETITVAVKPDPGYSMKPNSLTCTTAGGKTVLLTPEETTGGATPYNYRFTVPAEAVTLNAEFKEIRYYPVNIATTVTNGALMVMPVAQNGGYTEGADIMVIVKPGPGYSMKPNSLTCTTASGKTVPPIPGATTGGTTPYNYQFTMPAEAVTLNVVFEPLPTYTVTAAVVPNGTISVQPAAATEGMLVHVGLTPNPGYRLKPSTMGYYLKTGDDFHYPLAVAGSNSGYQFMMPNVAVTVYAEFEEIPETPLLPNPKLSVDQNRWDIYFNVPQELKQQVDNLNYDSRYVETTLLNAAGEVVLHQRSINAHIRTDQASSYTLYRTAALQPGRYQLLLTVGVGNQTIPLGRQTISVGDYLVVTHIWSERQNNCTPQTTALDVQMDIQGALASLDDITVELLRLEGNNETVVAAGIGAYRFRQNSATAGTATANDQNFEKETCTIYHFTFPAGTLSVGNYEVRVTHAKKETSYGQYASENKNFSVANKPAIASYTYDKTLQIFTIQTECMPAGDYATSYYQSGQQGTRWLTTSVNEAGVGKLDISSVELQPYMYFTVYNTATPGENINQLRIGNIELSFKSTDNGDKVERTLTVQNGLRYSGEIWQSYSEYLLPLGTTAITLETTGCSGAGKLSVYYTGADGQRKETEQAISDLSKPIALENIVIEQGRNYQVTLYDAKGDWLGNTSFQLAGFPVLSGKWHGAVTPFTGNTFSCPLYGTLNLTPEQRAKAEFLCIVNNKEVKLPVISFTDQLLKLDTTQIPDQAMLIIEAFLPGSTDTGTTTPGTGTTTPVQHLQFNCPLRVYRQPEETKLPTIAPIIPAAGATEFAVTYEGGLYPTADVTVNIYRIINDKLQSVLKNKNIGRKNVTLTSEQLGLSAGNYLLYFSMGNKVISAQWMKLNKLEYTVTFYDWDGTLLNTQSVAHGKDATAPTVPTRDGYVFTGWSGSYTEVSADMALVAQYAPSQLTVTFHAMDGELAEGMEASQDVGYGTLLTTQLEPTREGYDFAGWYPTIAGKTPWAFDTDKVTANLVLYAHWQAVSYSIGIDTKVPNDAIQCTKTAAKPGETVTVSVSPASGDKLKDLWWKGAQTTALEEISVENNQGHFEMPAENITLYASFEQTYSLTIFVKNAQGYPKEVTLYGKNGEGSQSTEHFAWNNAGTYQASFSDLTAGDYNIWLNMGGQDNWYSMGKDDVQVRDNNFVELTLPTRYTARGQVTSTTGTLPENLWISAASATGATDCFVNAEGYYTLTGLTAGTWTLKAYGNGTTYEMTPSTFIVENSDVTQNINITRGADLQVTLNTAETNPAFRAHLSLEEKESNQAWTTIWISGTDGSGADGTVFALKDGIKHPGTYRIAVQSLSAKNGVNVPFSSTALEFEVTQRDITAGTIAKIISYSYPVSAQTAFSGPGNFVTLDQSEVYPGGRVNLEIHYRNNSNSAQKATFAVTLPVGVTEVTQPGTILTVTNVEVGQSGKLVLALQLPQVLTALSIPVTLNTAEFGTATAALATVTLQAPAEVATWGPFKVYGEVAEGSAVSIKNAETGEVYATAIPSGRFYAANLSLNGQNSVKLVAEAVKGGNTLRSELRTVKVTNQPVTVQAVTYNQMAARQNSRLGFFSFCQYMSSELMGSPLSLQTQFANGDAITAVTYHFCGQDLKAEKKWNGWDATFCDWGGSGLKTITATVVSGGQTLELVVAEVTLLIDPSGVVADQNGKPLAGVTVTCQIKNGDLWTDWDAENYGQVNPQKTGVDGKYGWMVVDGTYRILATCPGYEPYDSLLDVNTSNNSIIIPPPRTDVDFQMKPVPQTIIAMPAENGTVTATVNSINAQKATPGETVSITVTAKYGYRIAGLHVLDGSGNEVPVNEAVAGLSLVAGTPDTKTYTFTMPGSMVRIQADMKAPVTFSITGVTYADKQATVMLTGAPVSGGTYYVAAYNDAGRLLGVTSANTGGTIVIQTLKKATKVKALLLNAQGIPQGAAVEYKTP